MVRARCFYCEADAQPFKRRSDGREMVHLHFECWLELVQDGVIGVAVREMLEKTGTIDVEVIKKLIEDIDKIGKKAGLFIEIAKLVQENSKSKKERESCD